MQYPPAPWRLKGHAVVQLQLLATARVRPFVPSALAVVSVVPGRTLGGIYLASYGVGSTWEYHELIVIPALVRHRGRVGGWVSHIYVDDQVSLAAGRAIWALPKQPADFQGENGGHGGATVVSQDQGALCVFRPGGAPGWLGRLPVFAPAFSARNGELLWFRGSGSARWGTGSGTVEVPASSPFSSLGFGRGRRFYLHDLNVLVHAPRP